MRYIGSNVLLLSLFILNGCGGGSSSNTDIIPTPQPDPSHPVTINGKVSYDLVRANSNYIGLNYATVVTEASKLVSVEAIDNTNKVLASTVTDSAGAYTLEIPLNSTVKIRVYARMINSSTPGWNVSVKDNTNNFSLYVMDGSYLLADRDISTRNLHAPSGWGGSAYISERVAAPFAMLDSVYKSMQKILSADPQAIFPPLSVNWSVNNKAANGDVEHGDIGTSYYYDNNLFILGDEDSDTDEYDDHVIAHEWAHYYEDKFSRSDSVGGPHSNGDILDIRVAFGEGWGNAFSAMALDNPVYFDSYGFRQAEGFNFNMESETKENPGWFSEASIQRILYDLYDNSNDGSDSLNLGFLPIHKVFTGSEKTTPAFTSIFSFITYLKDDNPAQETDIDAIVASEDIATVTDIYGTGRTNKPEEEPDYVDLTVAATVNVCPTYTYGVYNTLGNRRYIQLTIDSTSNYTISVSKSNMVGSTDPDFYLRNLSDYSFVFAEDATIDNETLTIDLSAGNYLLDVYDYKSVSGACFNVTIN